jgi:protein-disulfide isomerase
MRDGHSACLAVGRYRISTTSGDSNLLDAFGTVAFIAACVAIAWSVIYHPGPLNQTTAAALSNRPPARPEPPLPTAPVSLVDAITQGNPNAPVAVIEYSEFQCPYCGTFATRTFPSIKEKYVDSGKILWAYRHFPLEQIHGNALRAAIAAECAAQQGKFPQMHDILFSHQQELDSSHVNEYAKKAGLDTTLYSICVSGVAEAKVRRDMKEGQAFGVAGTPTFFIGQVQQDKTVKLTKRLFGASTVAAFEQALENALTSTIASAE